MAMPPPNPSAMRRANARDCTVVLREAERALTLAEIAAATGLSRPTVDAVLEELQATGIVVPAPAAASGSAGRPARRFRFAPSAATVAALDIGARTVRLNTSAANVPANVLYAGRGFTRHRPLWLPYPGLPLPGWTNLWELAL